MKTLRILSFFVLVALVSTTTCCAQTADEVVAKYLQAVGGKDLIASTKSVVVSSNIEVNGMDAPTTTTILAGKGYKMEADFNGSKIVQCVNDHGGWGVNAMAGQTSATAMPDADAKTARSRLNVVPFADYTANGGKIELVGKDTADYKIKLTNDLGFNAVFYINMQTYLIDRADVRINVQGQSVNATTHFSDYRKLDNGLMMAFKIQQVLPQYTLDIEANKVEVNKDIDPAIFEMPK